MEVGIGRFSSNTTKYKEYMLTIYQSLKYTSGNYFTLDKINHGWGKWNLDCNSTRH